MTFNYFSRIPSPAQLFLTGPGIPFLILLPTVSAQQASLPGQLIFSWTGTVQISCLSVKSFSLVPFTPYSFWHIYKLGFHKAQSCLLVEYASLKIQILGNNSYIFSDTWYMMFFSKLLDYSETWRFLKYTYFSDINSPPNGGLNPSDPTSHDFATAILQVRWGEGRDGRLFLHYQNSIAHNYENTERCGLPPWPA